MKTTIAILLFYSCFFISTQIKAQEGPHANTLTVEMSRKLSLEILGPNSGPFMQPLVTTSNATANSRFFRTAFVPKKVDKPYFRFGIHSMFGFVRDDQKTYTPIAPRMTFEQVLADTSTATISFTSVTIKDTAGLVLNILKYLFDKGLGVDSAKSGLKFPKEAATIFGNRPETFYISRQYFLDQIQTDDPYLAAIFRSNALSQATKDSLLNAIKSIPEKFPLPTGGNINSVYAAIPQLEIGSFYGTELLLRFIPPIEIDKNVGTFTFWGVGVKHSISQYFEKTPFDAAIQFVYQGTNLTNKVGETNADLNSNSTIYDLNIEASKSFKGIIDVFTGLSYETISISNSYKFLLPVEKQIELGLLRNPGVGIPAVPEPPEWPGDQKPQTVYSNLSDVNIKFVLGVAKQIGPVTIFLDYNISKFNIFTAGADVTF